MKRKILLTTVFIAMFLTLSVGFAQLPGQQPGPMFDEWQSKYIADPSAAIAALLAGEVDTCGVPTRADMETVLEAGFKTVEVPMWGVGMFWFNLDSGRITSDIDFRRAVAHLMPKEAILEEVLEPMAKYEYGFLSSNMLWYNPDVPDVTTFDPATAAFMLDEAGYTAGPDGWRIDPATGTTMQELQLVYMTDWPGSPHEVWAERWEIEMEKIGLPARIETTLLGGGEWHVKTMIERDFDVFYFLWDWFADPLILEYLYVTGGPFNVPGYSNPEFEEQMRIVTSTIDETEAKNALWRAQEILVEDLPGIPLCRRITFSAIHPDLLGFVPTAYYSENAYLRERWKAGPGGTIRTRASLEPDSWVVGWDSYGSIFWNPLSHLADADPFTGELIPWIATDWKVEPWSDPGLGVVEGSKTTVWIEDDIYWHDGVKFTAHDLEFAAKYGVDNEMPRLIALLRDFVDAKAVSETQVEFYYNRTSIFILRNILHVESHYLLAFPKHLYNPNATRYGPPEGPMGLQETGKPGVPDPSKFAAAFVPHPNPPADKPWLSCIIGVGLWILKNYEYGVGALWVANRNFHITALVTDLDFDRKVGIKDLYVTAIAFGTSPGDERWELMTDIDGDDYVGIKDLYIVARDFGKTY